MASEQEDQPVFYDALIHQRRRHGHYRTIDGPLPPLEHPLADSHCHLASLSQRDLSLARAALWKVDFICDITDPIEDAGRTYTQLPAWELSARSWMKLLYHASVLLVDVILIMRKTLLSLSKRVLLLTSKMSAHAAWVRLALITITIYPRVICNNRFFADRYN